ncbi:DUF3426 domain-containing protein [Desulfospira joergensenii]|uniref:DUF3426 domain-containing protein n=1 Tax=Desulfospira joergensenii TaxID=53329 RepID=UPI0003B48F14|nr:DUF3426 domain-containing protein [Desulfospira joergensenii]
MIITCEECSTSFHLDDSLLKPEGSKVRCSKCRSIFTAFPPGEEAPAEPEQESVVPMVDPGIEADMETGPDADLDGDMGADMDFDLDEDSQDMSLQGDELDFSDGEFDEEFDESDLEIDSGETDLETGDLPEEEADIEISFGDSDGGLEIDTGGLTLEMDDDSSLTMDFDPGMDEDEAERDGAGGDPDELEFDTEDIDFEDSLSLEETPPSADLGLEMESPMEDPEEEPDIISEDPDTGSGEIESLVPDIPDSDEEGGLFLEEEEPEFDLDFEEDQDLDLEPDTGFPEPDESSLEFDPSREMTLDTDSEEPEELEQAEEEEPDFSAYDQVLDQEIEPEPELEDMEEPFEPEVVQEDASPEPDADPALKEETETVEPGLTLEPPRRTRRKKSAMGAPVILLLLIFLITACAYIASIFMGYKIPYLSEIKIPFIEQFMGTDKAQTPPPKPVPSQKNINGRFISNDTAGELFIITGKVDNPAQITYQHIQVRGTLLTKGKVKAKTQTAFCGNIISEEILKTGNIADISKQLSVRDGMNNANLNIKPGGSVPFMLVFSDLPENLQNFTVEVEGFSKAGQTKK